MLKKAEIDNTICNIENAGGEEVIYSAPRKRFEYKMQYGGKQVKMAISAKDVMHFLYKTRHQPTIELQTIVINQPWFSI